MVLSVDMVDRNKKLLEHSYVLIERMKKLRALAADPRLVGIARCSPELQAPCGLSHTRRAFR